MVKTLSGPSAGAPQDPNINASRAPIEEILSPDVIAEMREDLKKDWYIMEREILIAARTYLVITG